MESIEAAVKAKREDTLVLLCRSMAENPPPPERLNDTVAFTAAPFAPLLPLLPTAMLIGSVPSQLPDDWAVRLMESVLPNPPVGANDAWSLTVAEAWGLMLVSIKTALTFRVAPPAMIAGLLSGPMPDAPSPEAVAVRLGALADALAGALEPLHLSELTGQIERLKGQSVDGG